MPCSKHPRTPSADQIHLSYDILKFEFFLLLAPASTRRVNGQNQRRGSHIKAPRVESRHANGSWGTRLAITTLRTRKPAPPHIQPAVSATVIYWPPTQTCPIMSVLHVTVTKVCGGELGGTMATDDASNHTHMAGYGSTHQIQMHHSIGTCRGKLLAS